MKSCKKPIYVVVFTFLLVASFSYFASILIVPTIASGERPQTFNRVILFSWDGVQYNHLMELYNAGSLGNLTELVNETQLPILRTFITSAMTATNWAHPSMLSGFGREMEEGTLDNVTVWENIEDWNSSWVTGAITAKDKFADTIFPYQWNDDDIDVRYAQNNYSDVIADKAIEFIQNYSDSSFFLFVHFRDPDSAGHSYGENSPQYTNAITACDRALGRVLDALDSEGIRDSTAIIVATDHGFREGDTNHWSLPYPTGDSNCYTVWIASSHGTVDPNDATNDFWDLDDVAPTIYSLIGLTDYRSRYPYITGFAIWDRALVAEFSLLTPYSVHLEVNYSTFYVGTRLEVMFYNFSGDYQANKTVWTGVTPNNVTLSEDVSHPLGLPIEKVTLALTDDLGNILRTVTSLLITQYAEFSPVDPYTVHLDLDYTFYEGSNLTVIFYSYFGAYRANITVWNGSTPARVQLSINITHPLGSRVENATLVLTYANGTIIRTITSVLAPLWTEFSLVTLYVVHLEVNGTLLEGSKLLIMFYDYSGSYDANLTVWTGATPANVTVCENYTRPFGLPVENATLVVTDDLGNVLKTVKSFVVRRFHLMNRLGVLGVDWTVPGADRTTIFREMVAIDLQWAYA